MYFSPTPCYPVPLRPTYSHHPTLKHPQPTILPQCERPSFTPIQTAAKIMVLYTINLIILDGKLEDKRFSAES